MRLASIAATGGLFATLSLAPSAVGSAQAVELRLGLITPPNHVWTQAANRFAERIAEETGGEVTIQAFPGGQLGSEADMFQQLQSGVLDMAWLTAAAVSTRVPSYFGWFTPFLVDDVSAAAAAAETDAAQAMLAELDAIGIKGQGYTFAGMRHILMGDEAVETEEDLANKKVRIYPFPAMQVWWQAAGAVPTPVGLNEIYQSLDNGLLDGVDIDLDALVGLSLEQVAEHLTLTAHMAWPMVAMTAPMAWDGLTPEQQETFQTVLDETLEWANQQQIEAEAAHLENISGAIDVIELDDAEGQFAAANEAFAAEFGGNEAIAAFQEQVGALSE